MNTKERTTINRDTSTRRLQSNLRSMSEGQRRRLGQKTLEKGGSVGLFSRAVKGAQDYAAMEDKAQQERDLGLLRGGKGRRGYYGD